MTGGFVTGGTPAMMIDNIRSKIEGSRRGESAKALGAFYTDAQVAEFLVWWGIRTGRDTVMDPSFGGGVFLRSACQRLLRLGGEPAAQVFGVEIEPETYTRITEELSDELGVKKRNLWQTDFFELNSIPARQVDVVVGNPPFIRYQRFAGEARKLALACAASQGVKLNELASSWAPFLIHSIAMVKPGGRLAMVVPMEITQAAYALPVLEHLSKSFGTVTFLTFKEKLFPDLNEEALLLLAESKGECDARFYWRDLGHAGLLAPMQQTGRRSFFGCRPVNAQAISQRREKLIEHFIPQKARDLYRELKNLPLTHHLGELADVGIGYVTGANDFFHLDPKAIETWGIPQAFLKPAVRRGRALAGLRFTQEDWHKALKTGEASYLLRIKNGEALPKSVRNYLEHGEAQGVSQTYKCRTRSPWFCVPHVHQPDAFLTYMSGMASRLVTNNAGAVAPNSLHILRLHPHVSLTMPAITALWQTSLTRLSAEIEGHALGGGMLKLEPTEAENVVIASSQRHNGRLVELAEELNALARNSDEATMQIRADAVVLQDGLGLSQKDCGLLRKAADSLRQRRYSRGTTA